MEDVCLELSQLLITKHVHAANGPEVLLDDLEGKVARGEPCFEAVVG
jgi:hypothetical protein